jgi:hypothetical protein
MKIGDIEFHAIIIPYWQNVIGVLYSTSKISNITISGDRITLPTPVGDSGDGLVLFWRVT